MWFFLLACSWSPNWVPYASPVQPMRSQMEIPWAELCIESHAPKNLDIAQVADNSEITENGVETRCSSVPENTKWYASIYFIRNCFAETEVHVLLELWRWFSTRQIPRVNWTAFIFHWARVRVTLPKSRVQWQLHINTVCSNHANLRFCL